jgi:hypothetical protein
VGLIGASLPRRRVDVRSSPARRRSSSAGRRASPAGRRAGPGKRRSSPASRRASNTAVVNQSLAASQDLKLRGARVQEEDGGPYRGSGPLFYLRTAESASSRQSSEQGLPNILLEISYSAGFRPKRLEENALYRPSKFAGCYMLSSRSYFRSAKILLLEDAVV